MESPHPTFIQKQPSSQTKWIWLRYGIDKRTQVFHIDTQSFTTVKDVLSSIDDMPSCNTKLLNEHGKELQPDDKVEAMREYIVKRYPMESKAAPKSIRRKRTYGETDHLKLDNKIGLTT